MGRFLSLLKRAFLRSFEHDLWGIAKGAAYSGILSLFPALLVLASVLAASNQREVLSDLVTRALKGLLPATTSAFAVRYFTERQDRPIEALVTTSILTLWTASGMMMSWMDGFRNAYQLPSIWNMFKQRAIAIYLVLLSFVPMSFATGLVVFGTQIEHWLMAHVSKGNAYYIVLAWVGVRWAISALTSVAVLALIYHHAVPRTQPWHSVIAGAVMATVAWFLATLAFSWYLTHVGEYSIVYGTFGVAIALMVWMYIISVIVLIGAEVNALLYPREVRIHRQRGDAVA
jgi:membrane protein